MDTFILYLPLRVKVTKKSWFSLNLNQYRNAHFFTLNAAKKEFKRLMKPQVIKLPKMNKVILYYKVFPKTKRLFDLDNIIGVQAKFIQDALVELKILPDDDFNYVIGYAVEFGEVDKQNPRVELTIKKVE